MRTKPGGWYETKPCTGCEPLTICRRLGLRPFCYCQCDGWCLSSAISLVPASPPMLPTLHAAYHGPGVGSGGAKPAQQLSDSPGLHLAKPWATAGAVQRPYERLTNTTCQPKRKQVTHEIGRNTARSTTIMRQNCRLFVIHLSELLSRRSLQETQSSPAWPGFGVREGGWEELFSVSQRSFFFLLLFSFHLPHATS